jgi:hypothetical protein
VFGVQVQRCEAQRVEQEVGWLWIRVGLQESDGVFNLNVRTETKKRQAVKNAKTVKNETK